MVICQFWDLGNSEILTQKPWFLVSSITHGAYESYRTPGAPGTLRINLSKYFVEWQRHWLFLQLVLLRLSMASTVVSAVLSIIYFYSQYLWKTNNLSLSTFVYIMISCFNLWASVTIISPHLMAPILLFNKLMSI